MATGRNHSSLTKKHIFMILNALPMVGPVLYQRLLEWFNANALCSKRLVKTETYIEKDDD